MFPALVLSVVPVRVEKFIYGNTQKGDDFIKGIEAGVLAPVLNIHDGARGEVYKLVWCYVKKKYKLNMNSILIFLIMPLQFRVSSILSSNFSHVCSAIHNYNDYESLPCYKMSRYIQIQAYMHAYNPLF